MTVLEGGDLTPERSREPLDKRTGPPLLRLLAALASRLAILASRRPVVMLLLLVMATAGLATATVFRLEINTNVNDMISTEIPWRAREAAFEKNFPLTLGRLVAVIEAPTAGEARQAAIALGERLRAMPDLFPLVSVPGGDTFFRENGLLFLETGELAALADRLYRAQGLLGPLSADPSLRGLAEALGLAIAGLDQGEADAGDIQPAFDAMTDILTRLHGGEAARFSWEEMIQGGTESPLGDRGFVVAWPQLDYAALEPGAEAIAALRAAATELGIGTGDGPRLKLTGEVPLQTEELSSVGDGMAVGLPLSLGLVALLLWLALGSPRLILAILTTLVTGLIWTAGFAALAIGALNMVSVAFAIMFVGIAVDFGIQFSLRYRDARFREGDLRGALERAAYEVGGSLSLAALVTAAGFFAFVPTDYLGVAELGLVAGAGMLIALFLNVTLLPALIALLKPGGESAPAGYRWLRPADGWIFRHYRLMLGLAVALMALAAIALPRLAFDANPLNLKDPEAESVATMRELLADPLLTPMTLGFAVRDPDAIPDLVARLEALPTVAQAISLRSFVPEGQAEKLAIIDDLALILGPTLGGQADGPPDDEETRAALEKLVVSADTQASETPFLADFAAALRAVLADPDLSSADLQQALISDLPFQLQSLAASLEAGEVALDTLPSALRREWIGGDGAYRIEIAPKADPEDPVAMDAFVAEVGSVVGELVGPPLALGKSAEAIQRSFIEAGASAAVVIALLLWAVLGRLSDVARVLAPVLWAGTLTLGTAAAIGLDLTFANVIALPLMPAIGVPFAVYLVMRWRSGGRYPLSSATARAVLFSGLTTGAAFGSLAASRHVGTADMGVLLLLALAYLLLGALLLLPAMLAQRGDPA